MNESDSGRKELGTSAGNRHDWQDGTFWIDGWSQGTSDKVVVGGVYTLRFTDGDSNPVEVSVKMKEKAGAGRRAGAPPRGLRFELTSKQATQAKEPFGI